MVVVNEPILKMIHEGVSLSKISEATGLYKSTLYYHYKKLKGKKYKEPQYEVTFSEVEGEIVGIFTGDGSQHYEKSNWNYQTNIHFGSDIDYVDHVKRLFEKFFNKKWGLNKEIPKNKNYKVKYRLRTADKKIFYFFHIYLEYISQHKHDTVYLRNLFFPKPFLFGFIRGLIDTDGCIRFDRGKPNVLYTTTSEKLAAQLVFFLKKLDFIATVNRYTSLKRNIKPVYIVRVSRKSVDSLLNQIKPFKAIKLGLVVEPGKTTPSHPLQAEEV